MAEPKTAYAVVDDGKRTLDDVIEGADIFLGCSGPKVLTGNGEENGSCANDPGAGEPGKPEILPPLAKKCRPDAIICTGRSDYPNQVNNVLCFPFIFRGALDVGATAINEEMKLAADARSQNWPTPNRAKWWLQRMAISISALVRIHHSKTVRFRVPIVRIAPAVAKAAMSRAWRRVRLLISTSTYKLTEFVYQNQPVYEAHFLPGSQSAEAGCRLPEGKRRAFCMPLRNW
ncbi:hypothetical protein ACLK19_16215 [Escherichia coli]